MKLEHILGRLQRWLGRKASHESMEGQESRRAIQGILQKLQDTQEQEYNCEETYQLLDQYAEMVKRGEDAQKVMPLVKHHLDICPDCREEFEALLQILENIPPQ